MRTGSILHIPKSRGSTYPSKSKGFYKGGRKKQTLAAQERSSGIHIKKKKKPQEQLQVLKKKQNPTPKKKKVKNINLQVEAKTTAEKIWQEIGW